ncbi:hypothetical protein C8R44DRAFT_858900 [Mycena epipterygia]|nr:hypothetical protein C8R44DRAFT_858900 [Mycena epipterygia]
MPHQPTVAEIRLNGVIACLTPTIGLLNAITDILGTPFIRAISSTTLSLITAVQNVKRNKDECIQLMENIHSILYAIISLHIKSEATGNLPPATLDHVGKFTETLYKIHTFLEAQQDGNKIKHFFRQNEMNTLRKDCQTGLEEALNVFKVETGFTITKDIIQIQKKTENMHQELLELVGNLSDGSSYISTDIGSNNSSSSFSMLPAQPKIFHGRESELENIVTGLKQQSAHIAILGAGGIGKTSLARAALHHPEVVAKYEHRFFVTADSATTSIELAALTGAHLGLEPGKDLIKSVIQFLSRGPSCLLVLDNLETPWEPLESRGEIEEFLSLVTDISHLALIITMRGAERPAKVRWTRPFLEPLNPLSYAAAQQTFVEIADDFHDSKDIDQLLQLTDNVPLAVNLMAHLVDYEGCSNVLARWETEKTALLSTGYDKQSSMDASIIISLASPRMTSGAQDLLSLLSILPDGLSNVELLECDLPIQDLLGSRATLLRTSLAYSDDKQRLKSLLPIREHIQSFSPPSRPLFHPLCKYFHLIMDLYQKYRGVHQNNTRINQITSNIGNLHQLLLWELHPNNPDLEDAIDCTLSLNAFGRLTGHSQTALMNAIPAVFPNHCDHRVEVKYLTEILNSGIHSPISDPESLLQQGRSHFLHFHDAVLEAEFYIAAGYYYRTHKNDVLAATKSYEKALSLAKLTGNSRQHSIAVNQIARMHACEAQEIAQLSANLYQEAIALQSEAACLIAMGQLKPSIFLCQRARDCLQLCGMQGGQLDHSVTSVLAEVHLQKSDYLEARSILCELAQKAQQGPDVDANILMNIAELDVMIGADFLKVQENLDNVKTIFSTVGRSRQLNQCDLILADLHLREGNEMAAEKLLQRCLDAARGNDTQAISYCLERLADVGRWTSTKINWSYQWAVVYLVYAQKTQQKLALYKALQFLGDVFLSEGDDHTPHNLFVVALDGFTYMDVHRSRADCMLRLGDIAKQRGHLVKAVDYWKQSHPLFEQSSQAKDIVQIDTRLASVDPAMLDTPDRISTSGQAASTYHNIG